MASYGFCNIRNRMLNLTFFPHKVQNCATFCPVLQDHTLSHKMYIGYTICKTRWVYELGKPPYKMGKAYEMTL